MKQITIEIENIEDIMSAKVDGLPHLEVFTIFYVTKNNREREHNFILNLN